MPSGSANGSTAAATITPESSASQPSTGISHSTPSTGRSSGSAGKAAARCQPEPGGPPEHQPVTMATIGISGLNALTESEPRLEMIFRSSRPPERPCRVLPANTPMSEWPVAGTR